MRLAKVSSHVHVWGGVSLTFCMCSCLSHLLLANVALVGLDAGVDDPVALELVQVVEGLVALFTLERPELRVNAQVSAHLRPNRELLPATTTTRRLLTANKGLSGAVISHAKRAPFSPQFDHQKSGCHERHVGMTFDVCQWKANCFAEKLRCVLSVSACCRWVIAVGGWTRNVYK